MTMFDAYAIGMRTTLDLDDDLLEFARQRARQRSITMGQVVSELVRAALEPKQSGKVRNGVLLFTPKPGARKPNLALVNELPRRAMSIALLDVNVLIALFDPAHPNHEDAHLWFGRQ